MILRRVSETEIEADPYCIWNAYVDLLATEDFDDLTPEQRTAHLVFWYMSEVENGGHFQYFENRGTDQLEVTLEALGVFEATCQQQILRDAGELWLGRARHHPETAEEFCEIALEGEMDSFDLRFNNCYPSLDDFLESYLQQHKSSFVRTVSE